MTVRLLLTSIAWIALGAFVIRFGRLTYSNPRRVRDRWYMGLSKKHWSLKFLRIVAVVWIYIGSLMVIAGITLPMPLVRGTTLAFVCAAIAAASLPFLLPHVRADLKREN